jgi:predicted signal transduction protein with EAL and GGDEF domain
MLIHAAGLANRVVAALGESFDVEGNVVSIGTSIGIAMAPEHGVDPGELMKRADVWLSIGQRHKGATGIRCSALKWVRR